MKTNLNAIKEMDSKQLSWLLNCVFFAGVNLKVLQLCNEQGIEVPEISLPKGFEDFSSDVNTDNIVENPFNEEWLIGEAEDALIDFSREDKLPIPLGSIILRMIKITPEEYEKMTKEMEGNGDNNE